MSQFGGTQAEAAWSRCRCMGQNSPASLRRSSLESSVAAEVEFLEDSLEDLRGSAEVDEDAAATEAARTLYDGGAADEERDKLGG